MRRYKCIIGTTDKVTILAMQGGQHNNINLKL